MNSNIKLSKKGKIILTILSIFLCILLISVIYLYSQLNKIKTVYIPTTNEELGIKDSIDKALEIKNITNIVLFGVDSRNASSNQHSRSDSIIILSIDEIHSKIKLTSIMRDTYVTVENHGETKITHAYAYGGPQLAIKTINQNFDMKIKDYATVDFFSFEKIINAMGGVKINVKKEEIAGVDSNMKGAAGIENKTPVKLVKPSLQLLNGMQAVTLSRIRYEGNGDYERTERQRTVLEGLFKKVSGAGAAKCAYLINDILPYVETSLSKSDILDLSTKVLALDISDVKQLRLPKDGYCQGKIIDKIYYLVADLDAAKKQLYSFIYMEDKNSAAQKVVFFMN